jgi:hypothetical protein
VRVVCVACITASQAISSQGRWGAEKIGVPAAPCESRDNVGSCLGTWLHFVVDADCRRAVIGVSASRTPPGGRCGVIGLLLRMLDRATAVLFLLTDSVSLQPKLRQFRRLCQKGRLVVGYDLKVRYRSTDTCRSWHWPNLNTSDSLIESHHSATPVGSVASVQAGRLQILE